MDQFDDLEAKLAAASLQLTKLLNSGERWGFQKEGAAAALRELNALRERLEACVTGDAITEEFMTTTLAQFGRTYPALLAAIGGAGGVA